MDTMLDVIILAVRFFMSIFKWIAGLLGNNSSQSDEEEVIVEHLPEVNFYEHMKRYLLTEQQLWEHKYPRRHRDNPQETIIKDYVVRSHAAKRQCCRCRKNYYFPNKKGKKGSKCYYHWGKMRMRGRYDVAPRGHGNSMSTKVYTCCGREPDASGCTECTHHVLNRVGPLRGYVSTDTWSNPHSRRKVFALDCEMCYTTQGLELTRFTVIDFQMNKVVDEFVKPSNPIVDYNTRFSGVTKEDLSGVTTTITDVHKILQNMLDKDTILLGHSLESDLNTLNVIHESVVDTAVVFPHPKGLPFKASLRKLVEDNLHKIIQAGDNGHDACEDARSCMELMLLKYQKDQMEKPRHLSALG